MVDASQCSLDGAVAAANAIFSQVFEQSKIAVSRLP